jgi:hypothetical protein
VFESISKVDSDLDNPIIADDRYFIFGITPYVRDSCVFILGLRKLLNMETASDNRCGYAGQQFEDAEVVVARQGCVLVFLGEIFVLDI